MKIEAEVHNSLYTFSESKSGVNGCSVSVGELPPIAQDGSSIGRPERQLTPPGCGGCGPSTLPAEHPNNRPDGPPPRSVFDCEHFQFIDEDEEDQDSSSSGSHASAPAETPTADEPAAADDEGTGSHLPEQLLVRHPVSDADDMSSEPVRRQVSFEESKRELKSLLKRGKGRKKGRVTFDEAVTLYCDDTEGIQLLQLTTGPDIICTDAYYMFDPPIEYQDIPPFEPPAEYRDQDEVVQQETTQPVDSAASEPTTPQCLPDGEPDPLNEMGADLIETVVADQVACQQTPPAIRDDSAVSVETENDADAVVETLSEESEPDTMNSVCANESDKLIERFLEAECVFPVDEELNSVFRELHSDFMNDGQNGALDDNLFRNLISFLSNAEDIPLEAGEFFSSTKFANTAEDTCQETEDDESSQTHSRTLSEADSDCSISSQDTIIVRLGEEDGEQPSTYEKSSKVAERVKVFESKSKSSTDQKDVILIEKQESLDEVFNEKSMEISCPDEKPRPLPRESLVMKNIQMHQAAVKMDKANEESLSRQSSGEQSVNSGNSQDPPQDADDSTSSDSRSGEVEEEIRLDDIGYDEEDADDYDEESFRGMAHGNSKIRRIIKKNALQCTLFRGIEAKRRQQPGIKYPRPKSPLLSQESLVEKLKWLTTVDEQKDADGMLNFHSKPPDVILSTGGIPVNGNMPHSTSSDDNVHNPSGMSYQQQQFYQMQRFAMPPNTKGGYYVRHEGYHPSLPRQRMSCPGHPSQMMPHNVAYAPARMVAHQSVAQMQWPEQQRNATVPRNFRDWRVIQRVMVSRNGDGNARGPSVPADYVRCANGTYPSSVPPDVSRTSRSKDELEQFVEQDSKRLDRIRKRYSLAEDEDDPTFGFARRPSVRGVQSRIQPNPSETLQGHGTNKIDPYVIFEESPGQGPHLLHSRSSPAYCADQLRTWSRDPNWRPENAQLYGPPGRSPGPMHIHRASVALTELPGNATIPYTHRKHLDTRYHSYAESMYGSTRTLPTKGWVPPDPRTCPNPSGAVSATVPPSQMLQVPPHASSKDERGVPEGASSSPKISSDSLYHSPVPDSIASGGPQKDEGVIYYSLNV